MIELRLPKRRETSRVTKYISASQDGLCSLDLFIVLFTFSAILKNLTSSIFPFDGQWGSFPRGKAVGCEADHSSPSSTQVWKEWSYNFTPPIRLLDIHGDGFTFHIFFCPFVPRVFIFLHFCIFTWFFLIILYFLSSSFVRVSLSLSFYSSIAVLTSFHPLFLYSFIPLSYCNPIFPTSGRTLISLTKSTEVTSQGLVSHALFVT